MKITVGSLKIPLLASTYCQGANLIFFLHTACCLMAVKMRNEEVAE